LNRYLVLHQFKDAFSEYISKFPPHGEVDISIELVLGVALALKSPYMMRTPKLVELNLQLKEMLEK